MLKNRFLVVILLVLALCCLTTSSLLANEPAVIKAVTVANPQDYDGPSPAMIWFYAAIFVNQYPVTVTYQWERSDGAKSRPQTVQINSPVQGVTTSWTFGAPGKNYQVWEQLHILEPNDLVSEPGQAAVNCVDERQNDDSQEWSSNLETPKQLEPINGAIFNYYPRQTTLRWSPVGGAQSYCVEVDYYDTKWVSERGKSYILLKDLNVFSYTFNFIGAQPGRWRVWAVDENGQESPKSKWSEFRFTR